MSGAERNGNDPCCLLWRASTLVCQPDNGMAKEEVDHGGLQRETHQCEQKRQSAATAITATRKSFSNIQQPNLRFKNGMVCYQLLETAQQLHCPSLALAEAPGPGPPQAAPAHAPKQLQGVQPGQTEKNSG